MTALLQTPATRTCARAGCERSTAWPKDPALVAALCKDHTGELLTDGSAVQPEWLHRLRARDETRRAVARQVAPQNPRTPVKQGRGRPRRLSAPEVI